MHSIEKGRRILVGIVSIMILASITVIVAFNLGVGQGRLIQQLVRFSLTILLAVFLLRIFLGFEKTDIMIQGIFKPAF